MKKRLFVLITVLMLILGLTLSASAANIYLNDEKIDFDITPDKIDRSTMLPLKEVSSKLSMHIINLSEERVSLFYRNNFYVLFMNKREVKSSKRYYSLDNTPLKVNGHVLVPMEFFVDVLNIDSRVGNPFKDKPEEPPHKDTRLEANLILEKNVYHEGEDILVKLLLENNSYQPQNLKFKSGQIYDFILKNNRGNIVKKWSEGKYFTQALRKVKLDPWESVLYKEKISTSNLKPGIYFIQGKLMSKSPIYTDPVTVYYED